MMNNNLYNKLSSSNAFESLKPMKKEKILTYKGIDALKKYIPKEGGKIPSQRELCQILIVGKKC